MTRSAAPDGRVVFEFVLTDRKPEDADALDARIDAYYNPTLSGIAALAYEGSTLGLSSLWTTTAKVSHGQTNCTQNKV